MGVLAEIDVFEARKHASLEIAEAIHDTEIDLSFVAHEVVHELALRLNGVMLREGHKGAALTGDGQIAAERVGADIQIDGGELLAGLVGCFLNDVAHVLARGGRGRRCYLPL